MNISRFLRRAVLGGLVASALLVTMGSPAMAATAPSLGTAESFAVLGGSTVTNTGATSMNGNIGVHPGSAITDLGTITLTNGGTAHAGDSVALQAQTAAVAANTALTGESCTQSFTGTAVEIGSQTLSPGVYCFSSSAQLTGTLTLSGDGVFIFKIGTALNTAVGSTVALIGTQPCNVFWQIGSSAVLFTNTTFVGNIVADQSITLQSGTTLFGRALAQNAAVTLDNNTITTAPCAAGVPTSTPTSPAPTATPPAATTTSVPSATPNGGNSPSRSATPSGSTAGVPPTAVATPTTPTSPPASPIEPPRIPPAPPALTAPPRFPNAGGSPHQEPSSMWLWALVVAIGGAVAVVGGIQTRNRNGR